MIDVRTASYQYPGQSDPAVRDVSLSVQPGEVIGIVGPNGSGKSTLGRVMKGLLLPTSGVVCVDGLDTRQDGLEVRKHVGLVFQNPNSQIVNAVVEQEIAFGPENLGLPTPEVRRRVDEALQAAGLEGRAEAESHSLSMAYKQRVALAAVIAMQPGYLILDEATAWLEPSTRWPLLRAVLSWASQRNAGLALITHRMDEVQVCQRIYGMLDGRIVISGTPQEVLENSEARSRLALEVPETYALATELRAEGLPVAPGEPIDRLAEAITDS